MTQTPDSMDKPLNREALQKLIIKHVEPHNGYINIGIVELMKLIDRYVEHELKETKDV